MVGTSVSHYRILEKLGGGGMGVVYDAEDTRLKRHVALKFLPPDLTRDDEAKQRFILEAQAASALDHPNVCTIHEIDETEDGQLFIAMARYDGETLKKRIERSRLSVGESVNIGIQVARGLVCAHEVGIVHRDIKPANLMLTARAEVKILDFGIAKLAGHEGLTRTGAVVGTAAYMAPEQIEGGDVDERADVWALGVVLYEMLAGEHPFWGSEELVLNAILRTEPRPIRDLQPETPAELAHIIHRSLQKPRESRYGSARELMADLLQCQTAFSASEAGLAAPRSWASAFKRPVVAIPAVAIVLAIAVLGGSWITHQARVRWARDEAVPEIGQLLEQDRYVAAYDLALTVERYLPDDRTLRDLWPAIATTATLETTPEGAEIYFREYDSPDQEWRYVGLSPLKDVRLPRGAFRWKIQKAGFAATEMARPSLSGTANFSPLMSSAGPSADMVLVPASEQGLALTGFNSAIRYSLGAFRIDRYEVTNRQFKEFVDSGGYKNPQYWTQLFVKGARTVSTEEAMTEFRDSTGRPGPARWELGDYPKGQDDYPVGGLSWYEAAAYAEYRGKRLPTLYHWTRAGLSGAGTLVMAPVVEASNFDGMGPAAVGKQSAVGWFGTYDMAGNVREWCWNEAGDHRWILGGAWNDPSYMFYNAYSVPPFDRSPQNGFRLVEYADAEPQATLTQPLEASRLDFRKAKPASDEVFEVFRRQYSPIGSELNSKVESVDQTSDSWIRETATFDAGYGGERVTVYLFLPKQAEPPFQPIIYFPGSGAFYNENSSAALQPSELDFIVRSNRALIWPIYKGSFERRDGFELLTGEKHLRARSEHMYYWRQDVGRTIDYLQTRSDIDGAKVGYVGSSLGASNPLPILAVEPRIQAAVLLSGGFPFVELPADADPVNYVSRIRIPILMISGNTDYLYPVETSQRPLFNLFGTDARDKKHIILEGGHGPGQIPRGQTIRETLAWFDRYMGAVK